MTTVFRTKLLGCGKHTEHQPDAIARARAIEYAAEIRPHGGKPKTKLLSDFFVAFVLEHELPDPSLLRRKPERFDNASPSRGVDRERRVRAGSN